MTGGTSVLNVVAVSPSGGTAHAKRTVVFDFVPGTLLLDVTDPDGDDNGPGNYAYPTSVRFHPGAFDIQRSRSSTTAPNIIFRVKNRDLSATFGSPLGAQLVDVYVHDPGAPDRRRPRRRIALAQLPDRAGVRVEPADPGAGLRPALRRRQRDARSARSRSRANPLSRFITFSVPKASLGHPAPGWAFTVVHAGQDGFSRDQARGFQPRRRTFQFGVCAARERRSALHVRPGPRAEGDRRDHGRRRPAVDELDYTLGPVVLTGVILP